MRKITLDTQQMFKSREINNRMMSYNIEMTEVTGGTFWKKYTQAQIDGTESFNLSGDLSDVTNMEGIMQYYPPINLYDETLRKRAKALGPCWIRVSGTWATKTYYDLDNSTNGVVPEGYRSILTKDQWVGVLDFVKEMNAKLLISISNCEGDHPNGKPLDLTQAKKIFDFSHNYGVDISAVEFMNEPNMLQMSGAPQGYTPEDYARDRDILTKWVKENYPDCLIAGPCVVTMAKVNDKDLTNMGMYGFYSTDELMAGCRLSPDIYSYHYYNGGSERIASVMTAIHWDASLAHTDDYLNCSPANTAYNATLRDKYIPGGRMWITEAGDAVGGGNTWASTYLDVFRTLNELGSFAAITDGVVFHNTLASSDYGFLEHGSFNPRPNYFAVLLWNKLMGDTVYNVSNLNGKECHVYCHSRKDGKEGYSFLVINNSPTESLKVNVPTVHKRYTLTGEKSMRSDVMCLNNKPLKPDINGESPLMTGLIEQSGIVELPPASCNFFLI